ncbi:MAG: hypothetical protein AAF479_14830 [Pseudomonadota bacterium]
MGIDASGPRPTATAVWITIRYVGLPLLTVLLCVDVIVWLVAEALWDVCFGIWCWF